MEQWAVKRLLRGYSVLTVNQVIKGFDPYHSNDHSYTISILCHCDCTRVIGTQ
jgi:hypothetical protein